MVERDERLAAVAAQLLEVAADLIVAAGVVVLGDEAAEDLAGGVPLLGRRGPVVRENVIDNGAEGPEHGGRARHRERVGLGLGTPQRLADRVAGDAQLPSDRANAQPLAVQSPNL